MHARPQFFVYTHSFNQKLYFYQTYLTFSAFSQKESMIYNPALTFYNRILPKPSHTLTQPTYSETNFNS